NAMDALIAQHGLVGPGFFCRDFRKLAVFTQCESTEPAVKPPIVLSDREIANAKSPGGELRAFFELRQAAQGLFCCDLDQLVDLSPAGERADLSEDQGEHLFGRGGFA